MIRSPNTAGAEHAVWSPCSTCWGQRRIYEDRNGEGLVPVTCPTCLGLGEQVQLDALRAGLPSTDATHVSPSRGAPRHLPAQPGEGA